MRVLADGVDEGRHLPVPLVRRGPRDRLVDRQLKVVGSDAVALRVRIAERPPDEHLVVAEVEAVDEDAGAERNLLVLREDVVHVAVEGHHPDRPQREAILRPGLRVVERIEVADGVVGLELAVRHESAGMHDALGDALAIEVADLLDEVIVLERGGSEATPNDAVPPNRRHRASGPQRAAPAAAARPSWMPSPNSSSIFALKAGISSGLRLVTMPWSTTTSSSTHSPPALRMSVRSEG